MKVPLQCPRAPARPPANGSDLPLFSPHGAMWRCFGGGTIPISVDASGLAGVLPGGASEPRHCPAPDCHWDPRDGSPAAAYRPLAAGDHCEIPRIIRTQRPCVVLPDLMMLPGPNGIALTETVPELADVQVIFISAYGRDEIIVRGLERGATDYLVKPFSATELSARVRTAWEPCRPPAGACRDAWTMRTWRRAERPLRRHTTSGGQGLFGREFAGVGVFTVIDGLVFTVFDGLWVRHRGRAGRVPRASQRPGRPTSRSSSSPPAGATRPSRGCWSGAPRTIWSSRLRRPSSRRGSGRRAVGRGERGTPGLTARGTRSHRGAPPAGFRAWFAPCRPRGDEPARPDQACSAPLRRAAAACSRRACASS